MADRKVIILGCGGFVGSHLAERLLSDGRFVTAEKGLLRVKVYSAGGDCTLARQAVERTMEELKEMQRQQASSIVVPGRGNGGSNIQMP